MHFSNMLQSSSVNKYGGIVPKRKPLISKASGTFQLGLGFQIWTGMVVSDILLMYTGSWTGLLWFCRLGSMQGIIQHHNMTHYCHYHYILSFYLRIFLLNKYNILSQEIKRMQKNEHLCRFLFCLRTARCRRDPKNNRSNRNFTAKNAGNNFSSAKLIY